MTDNQKKEVQAMLKQHVSGFSSQKRAINALQDVSESTAINVIKGNWESISDSMWRNIAKQVGYTVRGVWKYVPIRASKVLIDLLDDAGESGNTYGVIAAPGGSKSYTTEQFAKKETNTFHVICSEYFNRKIFLQNMLSAMGKESNGYNVSELMEEIVKTVMPLESPRFVMDEFDKVPDPVLCFGITLFNRLEDKCGLLYTGTEYLKKRIERGVRMNKKGYREFYSRMGRRFIHLPIPIEQEVADICRANGLKDAELVKSVWNDCEGDLRRVKRMVYKFRRKEQKKTAQNAA